MKNGIILLAECPRMDSSPIHHFLIEYYCENLIYISTMIRLG